MARIEPRKSSRGQKTYRVKWIVGGGRTGPTDGETCDSHTIAKRFKAAVELAGENRPAGYPKGCRGLPLAAAEPEPDIVDEPSFADIVQAYLAQPNHRAEPRQLEGYLRLFDNHVRRVILTLEDGRRVGPLGGLPISAVTAEVDQAWVVWMQSRKHLHKGELVPYSAKTIHNIHGTVISPTLNYASTQGYLDANPCNSVRLPSKSVRRVTRDEVPTADEIALWITLANQVSVLAGDLVSLAIATGLRFGELTALRRCDIDLKRRLLTVSGAIKERRAPRELYRADYGKSGMALRTIRLPKSVLALLERRLADLAPQGLLFTAARGGFFHSNGWSRTWAQVVDLAQKSDILTAATLHKMRHFHATELLAANVSMDTVSRRLGHASVLVTSAIYGHLAPEADQRAANVLDALMGGGKPTKTAKKKAKKEKKAVSRLLQAVAA